MDVGRYDVVARGTAVGNLIGQTVGPALEADRVLGYEAGAAGTSYLGSSLDVLGQQVFAPQLTITSARDANAAEFARWDDEGVECEPVTLVDQGRIVDLLTSRTTAGALRPWYEKGGRPVRSNGNAITREAQDTPLPRPGHLTVHPSTNGTTVEDLCRDIKKGLLLYDGGGMTDHGLSSIMYIPTALEITNGRVTGQVRGSGLQASSKRLWSKSLVAIGNDSTVEHVGVLNAKSQPSQFTVNTVSAPAARFTNVDVIQLGGDV
jgi:TldD protein